MLVTFTASCFETQVRATDEQHLLWPASETIAKRPENLLLGRTSKQNPVPCSVGHEVAPSLVLQSSMPVSVSVICLFPGTPVLFSTVDFAGSTHIAVAACVLRWTVSDLYP